MDGTIRNQEADGRHMPRPSAQVELFRDRCAELTATDTTPGLLLAIVPTEALAAFLLHSLRTSHRPYADTNIKIFDHGPLKFVKTPRDFLSLTAAQLQLLHKEFQILAAYIKEQFAPFDPNEVLSALPTLTWDDTAILAARVVHHLITAGFHPAYLNAYFATDRVVAEQISSVPAVLRAALEYFQARTHSVIIQFTPHG